MWHSWEYLDSLASCLFVGMGDIHSFLRIVDLSQCLLALNMAMVSLGPAWFLPFSPFYTWLSRGFFFYPWVLVIHQDVSWFDLGMYCGFFRWQCQAINSGSLCPACSRCSAPGVCRVLTKLCWWVHGAQPAVTGNAGWDPLRLFPCLLHTLLSKFLPARTP